MVTARDPQWELIQVCVSVGQWLGIPRSVGEIFGFIFASNAPVTFDEIVEGLGMSNGSASHGLRYLRRMGAIEVSYHARDRRDFFQPQMELRSVVSGFMAENILFHLRGVGDRLRTLSERNGNNDDPKQKALLDRIGILQNWNEQARVALTAALETLH
jgi:HTH-type transcriptional regulator, glycine betaine synthesis regulator